MHENNYVHTTIFIMLEVFARSELTFDLSSARG